MINAHDIYLSLMDGAGHPGSCGSDLLETNHGRHDAEKSFLFDYSSIFDLVSHWHQSPGVNAYGQPDCKISVFLTPSLLWEWRTIYFIEHYRWVKLTWNNYNQTIVHTSEIFWRVLQPTYSGQAITWLFWLWQLGEWQCKLFITPLQRAHVPPAELVDRLLFCHLLYSSLLVVGVYSN